jgi:hypothetical protein
MDLDAKAKSALVGPDGTPLDKPATFLTNDEAELLRQYQAWGAREGLQGSMTCNSCGKPMEVYVQSDIGFFCDCRVLFWRPS